MGTFFKAIFAGVGVVIGIVFAIFAGLVMLISSSDSTPTPTVNREIVRLTANELYDDYKENEVAFNLYFKDKIVEVSGRVKSVNKDIINQTFIMLDVGDFRTASVAVVKSDELSVAKLRKKEAVVFRCEEMRGGILGPYGEKCTIIQGQAV